MSQTYQIFSGKVRNSVITLVSAALLTIPSAIAQVGHPGGGQTSPSQTSPTTQPGGSPLDQTGNPQDTNIGQMADKAFVKKALQGGMAEVQLGQLALQKSSNDDVKQFAQKMVDDHTKLGDQLKPIAQQLNVKIPDSPSGKDKATMAKLQALNGDAFDKAYIKDMVKDHEQDKKEFNTEAKNTANPALQQAATQGEQVISDHLQMIQQIAQKNNVIASK